MLRWLGLLLVLVVVNGMILRQEYVLSHGTLMIVELAPVDPRSLMQGDYMRLGYNLGGKDGLLHVTQDAHGVVTSFEGKGAALRVADGTIPGAENWFFEEGQAHVFQDARYAELRVTEDGRASLVRVLGKGLQPL